MLAQRITQNAMLYLVGKKTIIALVGMGVGIGRWAMSGEVVGDGSKKWKTTSTPLLGWQTNIYFHEDGKLLSLFL